MWQTLLAMLYPPRCPLCDVLLHRRVAECPERRARLHALPAAAGSPLLARRWFDRASSCFAFEGAISEAIYGFKYRQRFDIVPYFGEKLAGFLQGRERYDLVAFVPLHPRRLRERGYNQSLLLADDVARRIGCRR